MHFFPNSPLQGVFFGSFLWATRMHLAPLTVLRDDDFNDNFPRVLSRRKTNPLAQKLSSPKWAARGFETVAEPKKLQAVAVVVVPRLQLQILDVRLPNFANDTAYNMFQVCILY